MAPAAAEAEAAPTGEREDGIPFASDFDRMIEEAEPAAPESAVAEAPSDAAANGPAAVHAEPPPAQRDENVLTVNEKPANPRRGWWQRLIAIVIARPRRSRRPPFAARLPQFPPRSGTACSGGRQRQEGESAGEPVVARLRPVAAAAAMMCGASRAPAHEGQGGASGIRDTEIENDIRTLATPVWRAAGLAAERCRHLPDQRQARSIRSSPAAQAIFLNTGLIERAETPNQLVGVIAHETGHIVGGHILRTKEAIHNASIETIIAMVVAAGAAVAAHNGAPLLGAPGVGNAPSCGSRSARRRRPTMRR